MRVRTLVMAGALLLITPLLGGLIERNSWDEALDIAAFHDDLPKVRQLLERGSVSRDGLRSAASRAVFRADAGMLQLLLDRGAPLDTICRTYGDTELDEAIMNARVDVFRLVYEHGVRCREGLRPLCRAARWRKTDIATYLLDHGEDVNGRDAGGETPLIAALQRDDSSWGLPDVPMVRLLLSRGADPNLTDGSGRSPLDYAKKTASPPAYLKLLRAAGARE